MRTSKLVGLMALTMLMGTFTVSSSSALSPRSVIRMFNRINPFAYAMFDECRRRQWKRCKKSVGISNQALKCRKKYHKKRPCKLWKKHQKNEKILRNRLKNLRRDFRTAKGKRKKQIRKALIRRTKDLAWTVAKMKKFGPTCKAYKACYDKNKEKTERFLRCLADGIGQSCANPNR